MKWHIKKYTFLSQSHNTEQVTSHSVTAGDIFIKKCTALMSRIVHRRAYQQTRTILFPYSEYKKILMEGGGGAKSTSNRAHPLLRFQSRLYVTLPGVTNDSQQKDSVSHYPNLQQPILRFTIRILALHYTVIPRLTKIIRSGITFVSRNLRQPKRDFPQVSIENRLIRSGCCPLFKDKFYKIVKSTL